MVYAQRAGESGMTKIVGCVEGFVELKVGSEWHIMDARVRMTIAMVEGGGMAMVEYRNVILEDDGDDDREEEV